MGKPENQRKMMLTIILIAICVLLQVDAQTTTSSAAATTSKAATTAAATSKTAATPAATTKSTAGTTTKTPSTSGGSTTTTAKVSTTSTTANPEPTPAPMPTPFSCEQYDDCTSCTLAKENPEQEGNSCVFCAQVNEPFQNPGGKCQRANIDCKDELIEIEHDDDDDDNDSCQYDMQQESEEIRDCKKCYESKHCVYCVTDGDYANGECNYSLCSKSGSPLFNVDRCTSEGNNAARFILSTFSVVAATITVSSL